uniref:tyrosine-protein phosphatase non-receptor type 18 isoform X3 n=1 Tax=Monopterus albus TaxID=43700 RepID=UPI0009B436FE|nr:tyrosine-protein phosphatase non-receptor type 18-like isoform X3 [Monopterus albus]
MELLPSLLSTLRSQDTGTLDHEYSLMRLQSTVLKRGLSLTTEAGALKENIKKNRYKDILPYDQSRVVLTLVTSDSDSDYINASFIKGASAELRYIASQGPLSSTLTDFWRMIWQHDVKVVIMACREIEMGKKKCECYWAPVHQSAAFGPFTVYNQGETHPSEDVVVRTLAVTYLQDCRAVIQYQFLSWPDHDVPYEAAGVLDLLERARDSQGAHGSPLLVHCSAGCGRTGVICALDYIHDLLVTKLTADFSIQKIVQQLRRQRPSAVQTKDQYRFIFTAVTCMFERALQSSGGQLCCSLPELKKPEEKSTTPASSTTRLSTQVAMNDTYAVVNKPKHPHPPTTSPTYADVALPRSSRTLPPTHYYDNDATGGAAAPIYSVVRPRPKSAMPACATATPANHRVGEEPLSMGDSGDYHLVPGLPPTDADYEDMSSSVSDMSGSCSPGGIGFNCRIQKPRGPRDPPAEWIQLKR